MQYVNMCNVWALLCDECVHVYGKVHTCFSIHIQTKSTRSIPGRHRQHRDAIVRRRNTRGTESLGLDIRAGVRACGSHYKLLLYVYIDQKTLCALGTYPVGTVNTVTRLSDAAIRDATSTVASVEPSSTKNISMFSYVCLSSDLIDGTRSAYEKQEPRSRSSKNEFYHQAHTSECSRVFRLQTMITIVRVCYCISVTNMGGKQCLQT